MPDQASSNACNACSAWIHPQAPQASLPLSEISLDASESHVTSTQLCPERPAARNTSTNPDDIASMKQKLEKLDEKWRWHLEQIRILRAEREELDAYIRYVLHPIHRLPTELLVKIFHHCVDADWEPRNSVSTLYPPWTVSQVCRKWRDAALGDPLLWSDIRISDLSAYTTTHSLKPISHRIRHQLLRSGSCPLHVAIYGSMITSAAWADIPQLVFSHSERFEVLDVRDYGPLLSKLAGLKPLGFPILRRLEARFETADTHSCLKIFHSCPHLQSAHFHGGRLVSLPWSQLTDLSCDPSYEITKIQHILPQLTNVTRLCFSSFGITTPDLDHLEPVLIPNLQHLDVQDSYYLTLITAPLVHDLTVSMIGSGHPAIFSFLSRSRCQITSFTLESYDLPEIVIRLLGALPEVTSFSWLPPIAEPTVNDVISALHERSESGDHVYCPKLEKLYIDCRAVRFLGIAPTVNRILDMISHRMGKPGEGGIKRVELTDVGARGVWKCTPMMARVEEIRENGVELIVKGTDRHISGLVTVSVV